MTSPARARHPPGPDHDHRPGPAGKPGGHTASLIRMLAAAAEQPIYAATRRRTPKGQQARRSAGGYQTLPYRLPYSSTRRGQQARPHIYATPLRAKNVRFCRRQALPDCRGGGIPVCRACCTGAPSPLAAKLVAVTAQGVSGDPGRDAGQGHDDPGRSRGRGMDATSGSSRGGPDPGTSRWSSSARSRSPGHRRVRLPGASASLSRRHAE